MGKQIQFYKNRVCLNVLANSYQNAKEVYDSARGHILVGILSKNYNTVEEAVEDLKIYSQTIDNSISIGLGNGDPNQWKMVADICAKYEPKHVNQVFSAVGYTRAKLNDDTVLINSLVSPSGKVGYVTISTGPLSSQADPAVIPIKTAIEMIKEMGGNSVKYFPMKGLATIEEFRAVAKVCKEMDFCLEPTGGIDLGNYSVILKTALEEGVPKVIPHIYSSIIDPDTGATKPEAVVKLYEMTKELVDQYE